MSEPLFKVGDRVFLDGVVTATILKAPKTSRGQYTIQFDETHPELGKCERVRADRLAPMEEKATSAGK
jgi:hypothetical protein